MCKYLPVICRLSVQTQWADLAEIDLQGTSAFTKEAEQKLLSENSFRLPSWSDDEWQQAQAQYTVQLENLSLAQ